jgi:hypothetical protein
MFCNDLFSYTCTNTTRQCLKIWFLFSLFITKFTMKKHTGLKDKALGEVKKVRGEGIGAENICYARHGFANWL